jgi:hypothetical protein
LGNWDDANKDLAQAQAIDYDPDTEAVRVIVTAKAAALEAERVQKRREDEEILREKVRKQREEIRKRQEEEEEEERKRAEEGMGGMPGGFPGGMEEWAACLEGCPGAEGRRGSSR